MIKTMRLDYNSSLGALTEYNDSFDSAILRIAYTGKNRNNTFISKDVFEKAIPSMFNVPIVANYIRENHEIGSHDSEIVMIDDSAELVNITEPVGVVPESANWFWEIVEDNGVLHEYLCTEVLLWRRQEAYKKIKENGVTKQSMEITVDNGRFENGYYVIDNFIFTAFCLLGTAEPCFENAALFTFSNENEGSVFNQQYQLMLNDYKAALIDTVTFSQDKEDEDLKEKEKFDNIDTSPVQLSDEYQEVVEKTIFKEEKIDEDIEDVTNESPDEVPEDKEDNNDEKDDNDKEDKSYALSRTVHDEINKYFYLHCEKYDVFGDGSCLAPVYAFFDYDEDLKEAYFYDYGSDYELYGCPYSFDGDAVFVDFKSKQRKKYIIADYIEPTRYSKLEFETVSAQLEVEKAKNLSLEQENVELKTFKHEVETQEKRQLVDQFASKLKDIAEYNEVKDGIEDFTLDELSTRLFALVGKISFDLSSAHNNSVTVAIPDEKITVSKYGNYLK